MHHKTAKQEFNGELWTQDELSWVRYGINRIEGKHADGLGRDAIHYGGNSGYQAINLAYLLGAARIVLLGYDMGKTGGKSHWHGDHPGDLNQQLPIHLWLSKFPTLADDLKREGVSVANATRETALDCFDRLSLEQALKQC